MLDQGGEARRVLRRMARMTHFDAVHSLLDERGDPFTCSRVRRMRQNREAASPMDERRRLGNGEPVFRDIRRTAIPQIPLERVAEIYGPALGDHRASHVRSADGAARGLLEHRRELDADAELVQALDHALGARAPHVAKRDELCLQLPRIGQVESEDVRFHVALDGAQFHAGHHADAELLGRRGRLGDAGDRVVIGQRDGGKADAFGLANDVGWGARSIGCSRVRVQIDERGCAVAVSGRSAHAE
jgi:hypothetical protein